VAVLLELGTNLRLGKNENLYWCVILGGKCPGEFPVPGGGLQGGQNSRDYFSGHRGSRNIF